VKCVRTEDLRLSDTKIFKMFIYENIIDNTEHIALVKGKINKEKDILVRMHSLNIFSDLLNQKKRNLDKAIDIISKNENGIIVIIRNPKTELSIKDNKIERISDNKILKEYGIGAQILTDLGVKKIRLLTSSSKNIVGIDGFGLEINGSQKL
jgi:3,4-dihydroxy 2-butanone 4-phosphate synthase/GTP cyclohydrolase II